VWRVQAIGHRPRARRVWSCELQGSEDRHGANLMTNKRFIMNAGRTTKQGQQINVGKDHAEYQVIVGTLTMHADDMQELGVSGGGRVRVWSDNGEATFVCQSGKVPRGMIFVPYGPPTCKLMGQQTDGTGMPTSKGWEV